MGYLREKEETLESRSLDGAEKDLTLVF